MKSSFKVLFSLLFFSQFVNAQVINEIQINGLNSVSRGTVLNYLPYEIGDDINKNELEIIAKKIFETELFSQIEVNIKNSTLTIDLKENPTIKYFDFIGYSEDKVLSEKIIEEIKKNFKLEVGDIFSEDKSKKLILNLKELYQNNAYYEVVISSKIDLDDSNRIGIELNIDENEPALIQKFSIKGNSFFETDDLLDLFNIGEPDIFFINYFSEKDVYDEKEFKAGLERIRSKYIDAGFADFQFIRALTNLNPEKSGIEIDVLLSEGERYKIGDIKFVGDITGFKEESLLDILDIEKNSFFNRKKLLKGIEDIRSIFSNQGYAFSTVETNLSKTKENLVYDLQILANKNKLVYVNRIEITGNSKTQDNVIRRKLLIQEGQIYSQQEIDDSIDRIKRLGYFSDVSLRSVKVDDEDDKLNLFINVVETKTGEISLGLSHSNSTGAAITGGIQQSNILGTGNTFNGRFTNSSAIQEISFYFSDPYFKKNGESISYGLFNRSTDASNLEISDYNLDESGFSLGYGIPLSAESDFSTNFKFTDINLKCGVLFSTIDYEQSQCGSNDSIDTNLSFKYLHNSLNDFYSPTDGSQTRLATSVSLPVGDFKYYTIEGSHSNYTPLSNSFTLLTKGHIQLAQGYGDSQLPFFKRYYGGGTSSVRGFNFNSLGEKYLNGKARGGELSYLTSTVIITPGKTFGIENENIRLGAFIDAGGIENKASNLDATNLRMSTGIGLTWLTPIGPIGVNAAKPILQKSGDSLETLSFALGMSF